MPNEWTTTYVKGAVNGRSSILPYQLDASLLLVPAPDTNSYRQMEILLEMIKREELPNDARLSTAKDLRAIDLRTRAAPPDVPEFADYFGKGESRRYLCERTVTVLRSPYSDGFRLDRGTGKYPVLVVLPDFEKLRRLEPPIDWREAIRDIDVVVGEIQVPASNWHVIKEFDEVFGVPAGVEATREHNTSYAVHFGFGPNPPKDPISGYYEVAVGRRSGWLRDEDRVCLSYVGRYEGCLSVGANYWRSGALSGDGFRPVRGSFTLDTPRLGKREFH